MPRDLKPRDTMPGDTMPGNESQLARGLGARVARWSLGLGAEPADAQVAGAAATRLALAEAEGHVCITVDRATQAALLASRVTQLADHGGAPLPLVLDAQSRLYFARAFDDERALARRLLRASRAPVDLQALDAATARLRSLFQGDVDRQGVACALALLKPLLVLSGGPGTGKTTTLARLLSCLLAAKPTLRIGLAAPTGKAALRMKAAVEGLFDDAASTTNEPSAPTSIHARTVHAWLGLNPVTGHARHDAQRPLPVDVLVVDEASMLDLSLARRLLDATPVHARVVLLGDRDQLAAVASGAVFAELAQTSVLDANTQAGIAALLNVDRARVSDALEPAVEASTEGDAPLASNVVWLTKSHRFGSDSGIGHLARAVRDGNADDALAVLRTDATTSSVAWHGVTAAAEANSPGTSPWRATLHRVMRESLAPYAQTIAALAYARDGDTEATFALQALHAHERFRVLTAVHAGPFGTQALNAMAADALRELLQGLDAPLQASGDGWYSGRAVLVTRNDPAHGLTNGSTGVALPPRNAEPWRVAFLDPAQGLRVWPAARLTALETGFATTVHKSQGSEHERVAIVLPTPWQRPCTRELLYTAITRARNRVDLLADEASLRQTIATRTQRLGGLSTRLIEASVARLG